MQNKEKRKIILKTPEIIYCEIQEKKLRKLFFILNREPKDLAPMK